ncbi:hypothetical protein HY643_04315, partial [Candidatus Woesearchaeota archaeon]|nr:hypothetical protein [Candidatus Woesearchaeota archaeon]
DTSGLADLTTYLLKVIPFDGTFNATSDQSAAAFTISNPPLIDYGNSFAPNNTYVNTNSVYINVSITEYNEANVTFRIYNLTALINYTTAAAGVRNLTFTGLADTTYLYNVTVTDALNNKNTTERRTAIVDATLPSALTITPTHNNPIDVNVVSTFSCSTSDTNIANTTIYLDGAVICTSSTSACSASHTPTTFGTKTLSCKATDLANNQKQQTQQITVNAQLGSTSSGGGGGGGGGGTSSTTTATTKIMAEKTTNLDTKNVWQQQQKIEIAEISKDNKIVFTAKSATHSITVKKVSAAENSVTLEIKSEPIIATITKGVKKEIDLDGDAISDLSLLLTGFVSNKANIQIEQLTQTKEEEPTKEVLKEKEGAAEKVQEETPQKEEGEIVFGEEAQEEFSAKTVIIPLLILFVVLALFILFEKKRKKIKH